MKVIYPAVDGTVDIPCWDRLDLSLKAERVHADPEALELIAEFDGPEGRRIILPGWWNGKDEWRVRFAPTTAGEWRYKIRCSDLDDSGLDGLSGFVQATEYTGELDVYRHGFLRVSDDRRGFTFDDGTPFFWLGDTHWQAPNYERLNMTNSPQDPEVSQFVTSVRAIKDQGFTVYQTYPDAAMNDGGGNVSQVDWWTDKYTKINPEAFTAQFDPFMEHLAEQGLVIALGMGVHWANGRIGVEAMTRFTRHVVARYASYPVVWLTGQEVDVENDLGTLPVWRAVAEVIEEADGYQHPLSVHMDSVGEPMTFGDEPWHDWFATQGGHGRLRSRQHYGMYWNREPTKPFLETEANYEGVLNVSPGDARRAAWRAMQCGSRGFTYGGAGTWAMKWGHDVPGWDEYQNGVVWYEGLELPERRQMVLLRRFYESLNDWQSLAPQFEGESHGAFAEPETALLSTDANRTYVVYFSGVRFETGVLRGLDPSWVYRARWYNPRNGAWLIITESLNAIDGVWKIPAKLDRQDWTLVVERAQHAANPPRG